MSLLLQKLFELVEKGENKIVVYDQQQESAYVLLSLAAYETLTKPTTSPIPVNDFSAKARISLPYLNENADTDTEEEVDLSGKYSREEMSAESPELPEQGAGQYYFEEDEQSPADITLENKPE